MRDEDDTAPKESDPRDIGLGAVPGVIGSQVHQRILSTNSFEFLLRSGSVLGTSEGQEDNEPDLVFKNLLT